MGNEIFRHLENQARGEGRSAGRLGRDVQCDVQHFTQLFGYQQMDSQPLKRRLSYRPLTLQMSLGGASW